MKNSFGLRVSRFGLKLKLLGVVTLLLLFVREGSAQDVRAKAEGEGKLMMYATFTAADSKTLLDGFKQVYPKIDSAYYRSNDSALMERFINENRAGQNICDVMVTTSFYGHNITKRGLFAVYDSPERKFFREGYKDLQANWTSIYTNYGAFGYNTRTVPKTSVPKAFSDLLKPEWKGQITLESRPYEWFGTTIKAMGEEKGIAYMRELAKQTELRTGRRRIQRRTHRLFANIRSLETHRGACGLGLFESSVRQHSSHRNRLESAASERGAAVYRLCSFQARPGGYSRHESYSRPN
jgi:hypothetical protein